MDYSKLTTLLPEKKCPKCGKRFIAAPMHRYRVYRTFYCSWTCFLHRNDPNTQPKTETKGNNKND